MALTRRGKAIVSGGALAGLVVLGMGAMALTGNAPAVVRNVTDSLGVTEPPATCPLTGQELPQGQQAPARPALAVKVENAPQARPQAGLDRADIVYEEPVEGGVTRFIVLFQCSDAPRLGPVRSARMTDISVLAQYGTPLFGFAGGAPQVRTAVASADVVDMNYVDAADQYVRDESRSVPHNLYTNTKHLYKASQSKQGAPEPVFTYADEIGVKAKPAATVHIPFSTTYADVNWAWDRSIGRWVRAHGTEAHVLENGDQVSITNLVIMQVEVRDSAIKDVTGAPSPEVKLVGTGKAWVLRDGKVIKGRWIRDAEGDVTRFETATGEQIALAPGTTWVELVPSSVPVEIGASASS